MSRRDQPVVIVGAGIGGLAAALVLSARGLPVHVIEKASAPGGKLRTITVGGIAVDSGPTLFTMKWVFDDLFGQAGTSLEAHIGLDRADILARHAWQDGEHFDLRADIDETVEAVAAFAGRADADGYRRFCADTRTIYRLLEDSFITNSRPTTPIELASRIGLRRVSAIPALKPFASMWQTLGKYFKDPRLRQLFGRYATYCGSSPFATPATLMLVTHVERQGVWLIRGGMTRLAEALAGIAAANGARFSLGRTVAGIVADGDGVAAVRLADGEIVPASAVVFNGDFTALAGGALGLVPAGLAPTPPADRSLSAITWSLRAETGGFPLSRHNVFFSRDYRAEFTDLFQRRTVPREPTVYICAQGRDDRGTLDPSRHGNGEPMLCLINAPPIGDAHDFTEGEAERCLEATRSVLSRCGLSISGPKADRVATTPTRFNSLFPGTGGALYGPASHGWKASFRRPGSRTTVAGLYLAGGSVHPGAGVPMAALSGRIAAESLISDRVSTPPSRRAAIFGGTSTR